MIKWHRLFGITLTDFFTGTGYSVELEKDLSLKQQLLDVLIIEKSKAGRLNKIPENELPDGLENLGKYNLMTYKSHQQALNAWTLDELTGHFVNYRKLISPSPDKLLPIDDFSLYGLSARYPENLEKYCELNPVNSGIYDIKWGGSIVRIIALSRVPKEEKNAIWNLFSAVPETVQFGFSKYKWRNEVSSVINEMLLKYKIEGVIAMPYTVEDFKREYAKEHIDELLDKLSVDEVMKKYSADERLKGISADEIMKKFSLDKRLKGVTSGELSELIKKRFSKKEQKEIFEMLKGI